MLEYIKQGHIIEANWFWMKDGVVVQESLLKRAEFCVVDLPEMNMPVRLEKNPVKIITERDIVFKNDKWRIVLTADKELTRDLS